MSMWELISFASYERVFVLIQSTAPVSFPNRWDEHLFHPRPLPDMTSHPAVM